MCLHLVLVGGGRDIVHIQTSDPLYHRASRHFLMSGEVSDSLCEACQTSVFGTSRPLLLGRGISSEIGIMIHFKSVFSCTRQ